MLAVVLALAAASAWAVGDFIGGLQSRRFPAVVVVALLEAFGLPIAVAALLISGEGGPSGQELAVGLSAGVVGAVALGLFFRAMAIGTISVVAPITSTAVALPVVVGLATGDALSALQAAGVACAALGIVLASREAIHDEAARGVSRASVGLALLAAVGIGSYFVLADAGADESILWFLVLSRTAATAVLLPFFLRAASRPARAQLPIFVVIGVLDLGAAGLFALANREGVLAVVAVVGALYPAGTVLLARGVLGERLARVQIVGVVACFVGVVLLVAG